MPVRATADGVLLCVRVTPRAPRDRVETITTSADGKRWLKVTVRAAPDDGAANAAVLACLARWLDCPRSALSLASGASARTKTVAVTGQRATDRLRDALDKLT